MVLLSALDGARPDRFDAVRVGERRASWSQLRAAGEMVAGQIAGAPAVAVFATPSLATLAAVVGALLAGVPVVPVAPDAGPLELIHILTDSGAALLLADGSGPDEPVPVPVPVLAIGADGRALGERPASGPGAERGTATATATATDTAMILYTSGTTGAPKGVLLSRDAIAHDLDALAAAWAWSPEDTLVHGLPLFHVHGLVLGVLGAFRVGSRLVHTGRPRPQAYAAARGTLYFGVPTVWSRICADPAAARALRGARLLVSGSAALPVPVFDGLFARAGHRVVERYGMTETLITVSARADGERRPGQVGVALPGVATRLVDDAGAVMPADGESIGELQVRGPTLFSGYLNRPEATAAAYTDDGWLRTGDVASIGKDGWHRILGRASTDLIKSGGYRVGAGEIEDALLCHPAVREAAVIGAPHPDLGEEIIAYVVADGVSETALAEFVATRLSWHKRPRRVRLVEALPRNQLGKVQKRLLRVEAEPGRGR